MLEIFHAHLRIICYLMSKEQGMTVAFTVFWQMETSCKEKTERKNLKTRKVRLLPFYSRTWHQSISLLVVSS
jgi:hypothetical protein